MLMGDLLIALKVIPTVFMALFPVVNPLGTSLLLTALTMGTDRREWRTTSRVIAFYSFLVLAFFYCFGYLILRLFGITIPVVQVSGGLVMALMGWQMLGEQGPGRHRGGDTQPAPLPADEEASLAGKAFYPYTFPLTIGPGGLAVAMTFGAHLQRGDGLVTGFVAGIVAIFLMCVVVFLCYANMQTLSAKASPAASKAISKMLSFFVICIGVQIFWEGLKALQA